MAGKSAVMEAFQEGRGIRAGTFSGNPVACAAVEATLPRLDAMDYPALLARGDAFRAFVEGAFAAEGMAVRTSGYGTVFSLWFAPEAPTDYDAAQRVADPRLSHDLHLALRRHGLLVMPSPYGRLYVSFAHDDEAFDIMRAAFDEAARAMGARRDPVP